MLPGGTRYSSIHFTNIGLKTRFWSSTNNGATWAYYVMLDYDAGSVGSNTYHQLYGFNVRCMKN